MTYRLTSAQRCVLADCTRTALVGWLVTDPAVEGKARRIQYKATGILGFGFSRFVTMAVTEFGADYRPGSVLPGVHFPLSLAEAAALANDIELEMATDGQLHAAGVMRPTASTASRKCARATGEPTPPCWWRSACPWTITSRLGARMSATACASSAGPSPPLPCPIRLPRSERHG
jgi:hypothetical protein